MLNLRKNFIYIGIISFLVFLVSISFVQYNHDIEHAIKFGEKENKHFVREVEREISPILKNIFSIESTQKSYLKNRVESEILDRITERLSRETNIVKLSIISNNGLIIYSSDHSEIGILESSEEDEEVNHSFSSEAIYQKNKKIRSLSQEEKITDIIKTYKVKKDLNNVQLGYLEVYSTVDSFLKEIEDDFIRLISVVSAIFALMFSILYMIALRADKVIKRQYKEIEDHKDDMQNDINKFSLAVEYSPVSIIITNVNGIIEYVNNKFHDATGWLDDDVIGKHKDMLCIKVDGDSCCFSKAFECENQTWVGSLRSTKKDGSTFWESSIVSPINNEKGEVINYVTIKEDITTRKEYEERLITQANHDPVTGLTNRMLTVDRLDLSIEKNLTSKNMLSLLFIDLDDFKKVNDMYGHEVGDLLLKEVANRLLESVKSIEYSHKSNDGMETVSRLGGDEFAIIIPNLHDINDVETLSENIIENIKKPFNIGGNEIYIGTSIGISISNSKSNDTSSSIMRNADYAMYNAKENGKNSFRFYTEDLNRHALRRMEIEHHLKKALKNGEIEMHYQPIYNSVTNKIAGVEALMRWTSPLIGSISPAEFIPIAESTGIIIELGEWCLKEACEASSKWDDNIFISVNVSPRQMMDANFLNSIKYSLNNAKINPDRLKIEITEGMLIDDSEKINKALDEIVATGVKLSIDDFGTGYSSLNYLHRYPFSVLKIDKTFVDNINIKKESVTLIKTIIAMSKELGLVVVAEGVETKEQKEFLIENKCDFLQGWYFEKAIPLKDLNNLLRKESNK